MRRVFRPVGVTTTVRTSEAVWPRSSVTWTVSEYVPSWVGVPLSDPAGVMVSPGGSVPDSRTQSSGAVPPDVCSWACRKTPTVPSSVRSAATDGSAAMRTCSDSVACCPSASVASRVKGKDRRGRRAAELAGRGVEGETVRQAAGLDGPCVRPGAATDRGRHVVGHADVAVRNGRQAERGDASIATDSVWIACCPPMSVATRVKGKDPAVVGVPLTSPVVGSRTRPSGRLPDSTDHV